MVPKAIHDLFENTATDQPEAQSSFVLFSNPLNLNSKDTERAAFESKIDSVISKIGISGKCPVICLFATARDQYRKPCTGMWKIIKEDFLDKSGCIIDIERSFFVGDAAGRLASWKPGKSADWSSVDRKFAVNIGLKFYTPEEFFLQEAIVPSFDLGRDPKSLPASLCVEGDTFIFSSEDDFDFHFQAESILMVIAVGSPASGKSTFYQRHFKPRNFVHVNRDTLKTIPKCLAAVRCAIKNSQSVYIDNTNPTIQSREVFISIAKELKIPVKCLLFTSDDWLCKHLDVFRSIRDKTEPLPSVAFKAFKSKYQPPSKPEGFDTILPVQFSGQFVTGDDIDLFQSYLF